MEIRMPMGQKIAKLTIRENTVASMFRGPLEILLVDDDRSFGSILKRSGAKSGLNITVCHDIDSLGSQMHNLFDVAIVDYDLGAVTGVEIVAYLEERTRNTSFVLISQSALPRNEEQTPTGWSFIHKARGNDAILSAVYEARSADLLGRHRKPTRQSAAK